MPLRPEERIVVDGEFPIMYDQVESEIQEQSELGVNIELKVDETYEPITVTQLADGGTVAWPIMIKGSRFPKGLRGRFEISIHDVSNEGGWLFRWRVVTYE